MTEQQNKGGRPKVVFDEQQTAQVEALGSILSQNQIADYFGIAENTLHAVFERQPEVFAAYKKGKARAIASVGGGLLRKAQKGDLGAMCFYLKTQAGWRERTRLDVHDEDGMLKPTTITIVPKAADDGED
jgi:hypothetical protein